VKRLGYTILALAILALSGTSAFAGTATSNLSATATISANCTISTNPLAFGAYDPIVANASTALNQTGIVTVTCTNGSAATITLGQGSNPNTGSTTALPLRRMNDGGTNFLSYSIFQDSGRTTVWGDTAGTGVTHTGTGTATALTVYGSVAAGQNVPAGNYTDTVVATVTF
jgi:spore coat protein U-like protein